MPKEKSNSKTLIIILAIILGIIVIGGIITGTTCWGLYKIGTKEENQKQPDEWQIENTYHNSRYSFSFRYPKTFIAQESVNGDGVSLTSSSPAISINAYGAANSQDQTLDEYLNNVRADLFKGAENAEEIAADDTSLAGYPAQERKWHYLSSADGSDTFLDQITTLKGDNFYTIEMIIGYGNYSEYSPMFEEIVDSYLFE
jgi:hypothetical protein